MEASFIGSVLQSVSPELLAALLLHVSGINPSGFLADGLIMEITDYVWLVGVIISAGVIIL